MTVFYLGSAVHCFLYPKGASVHGKVGSLYKLIRSGVKCSIQLNSIFVFIGQDEAAVGLLRARSKNVILCVGHLRRNAFELPSCSDRDHSCPVR